MKIILLIFFLAFGMPNTYSRTSSTWEDIDQIGFNEPSGIVFHPLRKTLFVVGDEGDICEIQRDGTLVKVKRIRHADFEGITYAPPTGFLYIAVEGEEKILEVNPEDFSVVREFRIERIFHGKTVLKKGGNGIEAITFVPDSLHKEGGTFYVANQSFDLQDKEDPSAIFEIELPLKKQNTGYAKILRYFPMDFVSLSGLCYNEKTDHIYALCSVDGLLLEITKDGKVISVEEDFPGIAQEGIAMDEENFFVAQDVGGIIKFRRW